MIAILGRVHAFSKDEEMRQYPDRIEFGPTRIQRLAAFFVPFLVVVGGVSLKLFVHHENLHFALALMFPPLLGFTIALGGDWMRPPTALTATDIRFCPRDALFQIIPQRLPWSVVSYIEAGRRGRQAFVVLCLRDGKRVRLRHPSGRVGDRRFEEALAVMRQRHMEACNGVLPAVTGAPIAERRVRLWVKAAAVLLPVAALAMHFWWLDRQSDRHDTPPEVASCDYLPRDLAAQAVPGGREVGFGIESLACRWGTERPWKQGTWLDMFIGTWSVHEAERSHEARKKGHPPGSVLHPLPGAKKNAYTVAWQDSWGFTAQGRAHVKGYLVTVDLHTRHAPSAAVAEQQVAGILQAIVRKLEKRV